MKKYDPDESAEVVVHLIVKGAKLTAGAIYRAAKEFYKAEKEKVKSSFDGQGRIPISKLTKLEDKVTNMETELTLEEVKLIEKEFRHCGVGRWSATKVGDNYIITFSDKNLSEVELAMKRYLNKKEKQKEASFDKKENKKSNEKGKNDFSLDGLENYKKKSDQFNSNREEKAKTRHTERSL